MDRSRLFTWSLVAALAGFIFGFDTVVISGANLPIRELWTKALSPWFHGFFIMSMALWGTLAGALFGGIPTQRWGRKKVLFSIGILYTLSAFGTALAQDPYTFSFFRFIGGVGIGVSSVVAPTYISEISTSAMRGRLVALYQFNIVFGILAAFLSNYLLDGVGGESDWRWMLGVLAVPSLLYTFLVPGLPESPRWLVTRKKNVTAARHILGKMGVADPDQAIASIQEAEKGAHGSRNISIMDRRYTRVMWLAFFIAFFNQLSGINFILYYAPQILQKAQLAEKDSLLNSIYIGGINLLFTFVGLYLIDRLGRKTLLIIGSLGYILSLAMVSFCFYAHTPPALLLVFLLLFIASHAIGQGAVIWVFIAEIFPNKVRAIGQSFGASVHWVFAALITLLTPVFLDEQKGLLKGAPWIIFAFFAGMMAIQLLWVLVQVPETKGVSLEELEQKLASS